MYSDHINLLIESGREAQLVFELIEEAEANAKITGPDQLYWQGRADMARLVDALMLNGITFGLRSGPTADKFTEFNHAIVDYLTARKAA